MTAKLRIKAKGIEIEWEGEVEYLKKDLPDLIASIVAALGVGISEEEEYKGHEKALKTGTFTTVSLAAKVKPNSASDLLKVALAKLQLSDGLTSVPASAILAEMKTATVYYKPAMPTNIHKNFQSLLGKSEINQPSTGHYVLSQAEAERLQALL